MEKFKEREMAAGVLAELEGKIPETTAKKQRWQAARLAAGLVEVEKYLLEKRATLLEAEKQLVTKEQACQFAGENAGKAQQKLRAELEKEPKRQEVQKEVLRLEGLKPKVKSLEETRKNVLIFAQKLQEGEGKQKKLKLAQEGLAKEMETAAKELEKGRNAGAQAELLTEKKKAAEKFLVRKRQWDDLTRKLAIARQQYEDEEKETAAAGSSYEELKLAVKKLLAAWSKGQAAVLAAILIPGEPCPVCGSPEHPMPTRPEGEQVPAESELKTWQQDLQKAENIYLQAKEKLGRLAVGMAEMEQQAAALQEELAEKADWELAHFQANVESLDEQLKNALDQAAKVSSLTLKLHELKTQEGELKEKLERLDVEVKANASQLSGLRAIIGELEAEVPENLRNEAALTQEINQHNQVLAAMALALEQARHDDQQASILLAQRETEYREGLDQLAKASGALQEARTAFSLRLVEVGFADEAAYREAKMPAGEIKALEQELQEFNNNLATFRERSKRAEEAVAGLARPHLELLEQALQEAADLQGELLAAKGQLTGLVEKEQEWLAKLQELEQTLVQLENDYQVLGHLAQVANGKNRLNLTLQRFVLGVMLDDVTIAASVRLKLMSRGRYQLQRTMERAHGRAAAGLDLEVFDNYTGKSRAVATLSGGESFLASLSLALGLADVVQAYAGGIHLDTIFVDEGFGSLDPETLDLAMNTLLDLQQGGRLVGIISHVGELKERIDARLEVRPQERGRGSRAHFRLS
jgi:exonuclease SbcC